MKDTTPEAERLQREIIHSKTDYARAMMGIDMIESTRKVVMNSIREKKPDLSEREVVAELFVRYHGQEFSPKEIRVIKNGIINFKQP
ncbi:MAG: hypothetical protein GVY08_00455 [Bacteroidetes bacterium]|jgi:hypothetical protein|nr:hypothetical protein [Bacteroidota bacterium]